ncbi:MAG: hypothetical protein ACRECP_08590 [Methylocella sp.]
MAEIKLMPQRAPVTSTTGVSPRRPEVRAAAMNAADLRGVAEIYLSPLI